MSRWTNLAASAYAIAALALSLVSVDAADPATCHECLSSINQAWCGFTQRCATVTAAQGVHCWPGPSGDLSYSSSTVHAPIVTSTSSNTVEGGGVNGWVVEAMACAAAYPFATCKGGGAGAPVVLTDSLDHISLTPPNTVYSPGLDCLWLMTPMYRSGWGVNERVTKAYSLTKVRLLRADLRVGDKLQLIAALPGPDDESLPQPGAMLVEYIGGEVVGANALTVNGPCYLRFISAAGPPAAANLMATGFQVSFSGQMTPIPQTILFLFLGVGCGCSVAFVWMAALLHKWHTRHIRARRALHEEVVATAPFDSHPARRGGGLSTQELDAHTQSLKYGASAHACAAAAPFATVTASAAAVAPEAAAAEGLAVAVSTDEGGEEGEREKGGRMLSAVALTDCAICLAAFEGGDVLRRLRCGHAFHGACLQPWVDHHSDCPLCKACIRGGKGEPAAGGGAGSPPPLPPAQQQQQQGPARQSQGVASWLIGRRVFWRARNGRVQTQAAPW